MFFAKDDGMMKIVLCGCGSARSRCWSPQNFMSERRMQAGARVGVDMAAKFLKHALDEGIWVYSIVPFLCGR